MDLKLNDFNIILERIRPHITKTTLLRCEALEAYLKTNQRIFLKLENEQPTHSFKVRGAFNALLSLVPEDRVKGIVTRSSGNFAQAVAYAGKLLNIKTRIVMPTNAPEVKRVGTESFGPEITFAGTTHEEGNAAVSKINAATGATILSPYNHHDVIGGQGTISLEVYDELPTVTHFFCPLGGGGLLGGCSAALKQLNPAVEVVGIEPEGAADYYLSRLQGKPCSVEHIDTICDGLRAHQVGSLNRPLLDRYVDKVSTVSDQAVIQAMKFLRDNCNLMIEPSGAIAVAALMHLNPSLKGDTVCIISGSNVDIVAYEKWMQEC